ncbi:hypothetical protein IJJ97_04755 [bacterium]|nr:hypothetical protein [bacterium]
MTVLRQQVLNLLENIPDDYIEDVFHLLENFFVSKNILIQKSKKILAYEAMENMKKKSHFPKNFNYENELREGIIEKHGYFD